MPKFVYKADTAYGDEKKGIVEAHTISDARRLLRENGLISTYLEDAKLYKKRRRAHKRRQKMIVRIGVVLIIGALVLSAWIAREAERETAPMVSGLQDSGVLRGNAGTIVADTQKAENFAHRIIQAWNSFAPRLITGIEVRNNLMTLYVSGTAVGIDANDLEVLATNTLTALQREFNSTGATMLIIEDDVTIMELYYNPYTRSMKIQDYR